MTTRTRYSATYLFPGMLFPEDVTKDIEANTWEAILLAQPNQDGYFSQDNWYAVRVRLITEKLFTAEDGEEQWIKMATDNLRSYVIGDKIHVDDIPERDERGNLNDILKSNIRVNSKDGGWGVKTRTGNWQLASDYDEVVRPWN